MIHCGYSQTTPFCAFCGEHLTTRGPLSELLEECRRRVKLHETKVAVRKDVIATLPKTRTPTQGILQEELCLTKWTSWERALAEVLRELPDSD